MKKTFLTSFLFSLYLIISAGKPKFDWAKRIGGIGYDNGSSITLDASGNVFTTGSYQSTTDFDPGSGTYNFTTTTTNAFISKLDSKGNFIWARNIGGIGEAESNCIELDDSGNIYVTGQFISSIDFDPGASNYLLESVKLATFILKLNRAGNFVWAKSIAGNIGSWGSGIIVDKLNNVFVTGGFIGTSDFDPDSGSNYNLTAPGGTYGSNLFILKLYANGQFAWAKSIGEDYDEVGQSIALDETGNIYIVGEFGGLCDFDPGPGKLILGNSGMFVMKMSNAGQFIWAKIIEGFDDRMNSIVLDNKGCMYMTGKFTQTKDFDMDTGKLLLTSVNQVSDIFVMKTDTSGKFIWAKKIGGNSYNEGLDIGVSASGYVYTTGILMGTADFDPGSDSFYLSSMGNQDIYISLMDNSGNFIWATRMGNTVADFGVSIITDKAENVYAIGWFSGTADFNPGPATYNLSSSGFDGNDIYILKLNNCPLINTAIVINGTSLKANQTGATYQWIDCNNGKKPIAGEISQTFKVKTTGNYAVIVTIGACSDTSACQMINVTGIASQVSESNFNIYPNPSNGVFIITYKAKIEHVIVEVYNITGALVYRIEGVGEILPIDISDETNGLYVLKVTYNNDTISTHKIIKS